jgi:antitoxin component of MazEF toxin-antitoxin module
MSQRQLKEKNIRKLMRMGENGGSVGLTLPIEIVKKLGWKEKQKVVVSLKRKNIIIKDWKN